MNYKLAGLIINMSPKELFAIILAVLAIIISGINLAMILNLQKLRKTFFAGKQAANLEDFIINQNKKINELLSQTEFIETEIKKLQDDQKFSIQKIGLVRYNPFADDGGNLSFSMALLDAHNNGVVITSMHGREQNRIYSKPIKAAKSEFNLTEEEQAAIKSSKNF